jgi:hypothetical protein
MAQRGCPWDYPQGPNARKLRRQSLLHTVDEVGLLWIAGEILEREHSQRFNSWRGAASHRFSQRA